MSVIGTGVAAGVAQTAHNAQQVAREQDKKRREASSASREVRDRYEHLIQDLEEGEDAGTAARLVVDDQVPDHEQSHLPQEDENAKKSPQPLDELAKQPEALALQQRLTQQNGNGSFQHLDVEA